MTRTTLSPLPATGRRRFLQGGTGGFAAAALGGLIRPAAAQEAPSLPDTAIGRPEPQIEQPPPLEPGRRLGWAVVGLGKFAMNQIIPSFAESKQSRLVGLVSGNRAKAEQVAARYGVPASGLYGYDDFDRIADNPEVDIVYIILPNGLHAEWTVRAARAGKHVMCEKPMANTVADCETMIGAVRDAGRKLMIAYRAQYEPFNLEAMRLARSGALGRLRLVTSDHGRTLDPSDPADQWRMDRSLAGGGSLYDIGIYSLQAARYITGEEPVEITAMIDTPADDPRFREVEDLVAFQLRFPSGALAQCSSSYSYADTKRLQAFGAAGGLRLDPATDYYRHRLWVAREREERELMLDEGNQFALEMDHLSQAAMANTEPKTPGEEGLRDVRLMQAIYEAAEGGTPVKV